MPSSRRRDVAVTLDRREAYSDATETTQLIDDGAEDVHPAGGAARGDVTDDEFEGLPWWRVPSVYWLLGPVALFTLAFGGMLVPKINLILDLVCAQHFADQTLLDPNTPFTPIVLGSDNPQCRLPEVQSKVSYFMLILNFVTGVLSAIVAPKLGRLSDRYGRRRLLALASVGGVLNETVLIICAKFPNTINYRWLVVGYIFDGLTGSFTASNVLSQAYASDCTPPSKRAVRIGYLHACIFSGLAIGPLLAGYFVKWTGSLISIFYVTLGCHVVFVLVVGFVIPDSLSKKKKQVAQAKYEREKEAREAREAQGIGLGSWGSNANPFSGLSILWPTGPGTSFRLRINLVSLAITDSIIFGLNMAAGQIIILYSRFLFDWGTFESSRFISALSSVRVVVLMGIAPIIHYFGRVRPAARLRRTSGITVADVNSGADKLDIWVLRIALLSDMLGCLGYVLARSEGLFFASGMVTALGGLGSATIQASITKHVPHDRIGEVLGSVGMLQALSRVIGPVLFNGIYGATVETFPQAFLVLLLSLYGVGLLSSLILKPNVHWQEEKHIDAEDEADQLDPALYAFRSRTAVELPAESASLIQ